MSRQNNRDNVINKIQKLCQDRRGRPNATENFRREQLMKLAEKKFSSVCSLLFSGSCSSYTHAHIHAKPHANVSSTQQQQRQQQETVKVKQTHVARGERKLACISKHNLL
uniref:Uncharacterized protein n=1 Tax=Rhizophora mucronata TaxID=61149 RepID=A0A2P2JPM5_RHIMU